MAAGVNPPHCGPGSAPALLRPWRRRVQLLGLLLLLLIPWLRLGGESLLRFDLPGGLFHFAGFTLGLEEFYLLGPALLGLLFLLLLLTLVLGRVWCGWLCPQTWLAELAEGAARTLQLRVTPRAMGGPLRRRLLFHLCCLLLALLLATALVGYFMPPQLYWQRLLGGTLGPWPLGTTLLLTGLLYADLVWIRRLACLDFCPYGRFQAILLDSGTLTLGLDPAAAQLCHDCRACLRACPMGIDIRQGSQVECVNCATCLDACRRVMARQGGHGLIRYTFGTGERGWRALLSPRLFLLSLLLLLAWGTFAYQLATREELSLQVSRVVVGESRVTAAGEEVLFFTARVAGRAGGGGSYRLRARLADGLPLLLMGPGNEPVRLAPRQRRRLDFALALPPGPTGEKVALLFMMVDDQGREQTRRGLEFTRR
ncbi:4Fe-4S dicluster domain-containing protein [Desulfurivibrio sp. D14AmB]|uniref:4Fe-4S dicluster domain-containing protein n=1 Tax=Desulfurivibrio sp. D14AmB TaxID=3374370 RepID=UPI00376F38A2